MTKGRRQGRITEGWHEATAFSILSLSPRVVRERERRSSLFVAADVFQPAQCEPQGLVPCDAVDRNSVQVRGQRQESVEGHERVQRGGGGAARPPTRPQRAKPRSTKPRSC